jgi:hypothetical protein
LFQRRGLILGSLNLRLPFLHYLLGEVGDGLLMMSSQLSDCETCLAFLMDVCEQPNDDKRGRKKKKSHSENGLVHLEILLHDMENIYDFL